MPSRCFGPAGDVGELDLLALWDDHTAAGSGTVRHGELHTVHLPGQRGHDQLRGEAPALLDGADRVDVALEVEAEGVSIQKVF